MKHSINYFFATLFLIALSCNDQIDLPIPRGFEPIVVIQGHVAKTKSSLNAKVIISNSSSSTSFSALIRVTSVVMENDKGQSIKLSEGQDGSYIANIPLTSSTFDTKLGVKYRLIVVDFKNNKYESTFEDIISGSTLSNPKFKVDERTVTNANGGTDKIKYFTSTVDINKQPASGSLFKFDYELSYSIQEGILGQPPRPRKCYVTNLIEAKGVTLQETKTLAPDKLKNYPAFETELDSKFAEQAYVNIIMGTITEGAQEYFEQLNLLRSRDVSIFQSQGDRLASNFTTVSNTEVPVIGYFYGTFQDTARMRIMPSQVGNPANICPTGLNEVGACIFPDCCNCLLLKGSSTLKPSFWQ